MKFEIKNNLEKIILELLKGGFQNSFVLNSLKQRCFGNRQKIWDYLPQKHCLLKAYHKLLQEKRIKQNILTGINSLAKRSFILKIFH